MLLDAICFIFDASLSRVTVPIARPGLRVPPSTCVDVPLNKERTLMFLDCRFYAPIEQFLELGCLWPLPQLETGVTLHLWHIAFTDAILRFYVPIKQF